MNLRLFFRSPILILVAGLASVTAQQPQAPARGFTEGFVTARINVRSATGSPLPTQAIVRITQRVGSFEKTQNTVEAGTAEFSGLPPGDYTVEVRAVGFQVATEEVTLFAASTVAHVYILVRPESMPGGVIPSGPPILAPKAQKEVREALRAMEEGNLNKAEEHLRRAEKLAPGHPETQYLYGILLARQNKMEAARARLEKAISLDPHHAPALGALGRLLMRSGDLSGAAAFLERALVVDARSEETNSLLAMVFFQQKNLEKARYHAQQALELAAGKAPTTRLLLGQILMAQSNLKDADEVFRAFLADYPTHPDAEVVRRQLAALSGVPGVAGAGDSSGGIELRGAARPVGEGPSELGVRQAADRVLPLTSLTPELVPGARLPDPVEWAPKDIDEVRPAVFREVACPQENVIRRAGQRVADLINHLGDVNAKEKIVHTAIDRHGRPGRTESAAFEYMFSYRRGRQGVLWVEEFRDSLQGNRMVGGIGTSGFAAMALVFHPFYSGDFEMRCEGQGSWKGEAVWYVRFQQRDDKPARMRSYVGGRGSGGLRFKGRAWIAANSLQIVRLETDVIEPPRNLRFESEHMVIEFASVRFKERKREFWLPVAVDIYAHERGRRWHRNHSLANYVHFAVDTKQKITDPDLPKDPDKPPQS